MKFLWLRNDIILKQSNSSLNPIDIFRQIPPKKRAIFQAISGHQISPLVDELGPSFKKMLLVRKPHEQVPSLYFHHLRNKSNSPSNKEISSYVSLNDFVRSESDYYPNPQVRSLFFNDLEILKNHDLAKKEIVKLVTTKIDLCGTTDQFEDFLAIASVQLNWKPFTYQILNQKPKSEHTISKDIIREINKRNTLDLFLYEQVVVKFKSLLETHHGNRNFYASNTHSPFDRLINKIQQYRVASMANLKLKKEAQFQSAFLKYFKK
ncbi:hypothetical protein [Ekhidna sp. To15]|uniref:hypothetical protein n=1 Tax=Ekhidna sp. To15 TaxID=3395267 RepID=UPI003F51C842